MQTINYSGTKLHDLYLSIASLHATFNEQKAAGGKPIISATFRAVAINDFFKAIQYFKVPMRLLKTSNGEVLGYCFHYNPDRDLRFTVATELLVQPKYDLVKNMN
jgi:hypothetical protein